MKGALACEKVLNAPDGLRTPKSPLGDAAFAVLRPGPKREHNCARKPGTFMNIHHLELFYYVARHGGISEAVRKIPYGIQQPAVSGQILQLEEFLGVALFHRRPFALTPAGEELYRFIQPFFDNLESMKKKLRGDASQHVRIG